MLIEFWRSPIKWRMLKTVLHPKFIYHMITFSWHRSLAEAFFHYFADNAPYTDDVWQLFITIANCQHVNWPMIKLAHQLKDQGYQLGILSNISEDAYLNLARRFPTIFDLFDPIITACAYNNFITKPSPQVYQHLLKELDMHESVMFIDDNQKNICGSLPFGIIALKYTDIDRLKEQLATLGIDVHHND
jgi:FMN phosphatase YigB (HAD superfamily)